MWVCRLCRYINSSAQCRVCGSCRYLPAGQRSRTFATMPGTSRVLRRFPLAIYSPSREATRRETLSLSQREVRELLFFVVMLREEPLSASKK
jgi:hypothetical protein